MPRRRHRHALLGAVLLACGCQAIGGTGSDESTRQNAALAAVEAGSDIVKHKGTAAQAAKAAALAAASKGGNARVVMKAAYASATTAVIVNGGTAEEAGKAAVDAVLAAGGEASNAQEAFLSAFRAARKAGLPRGVPEHESTPSSLSQITTAELDLNSAASAAAAVMRESKGKQGDALDLAILSSGEAAGTWVITHGGTPRAAADAAAQAVRVANGTDLQVFEAVTGAAAAAVLSASGSVEEAAKTASEAVKRAGGSEDDARFAANSVSKSIQRHQATASKLKASAATAAAKADRVEVTVRVDMELVGTTKEKVKEAEPQLANTVATWVHVKDASHVAIIQRTQWETAVILRLSIKVGGADQQQANQQALKVMVVLQKPNFKAAALEAMKRVISTSGLQDLRISEPQVKGQQDQPAWMRSPRQNESDYVEENTGLLVLILLAAMMVGIVSRKIGMDTVEHKLTGVEKRNRSLSEMPDNQELSDMFDDDSGAEYDEEDTLMDGPDDEPAIPNAPRSREQLI